MAVSFNETAGNMLPVERGVVLEVPRGPLPEAPLDRSISYQEDPNAVGREDVMSMSNASSRSAEISRSMKRTFSTLTLIQFSRRKRLQRIFNFSAVFGVDKMLSDAYRWVTIVMVATSTMLFIIVSMPGFYEPQMAIDDTRWWFDVELVVVAFFTTDFAIRLSLLDGMEDFLSGHLLVDFLSFVGFYLELIVAASDSATNSSAVGFTLLRLLRIARILRLFKLGRQNGGLPMLWQVLLQSKDGLFLLVVLVGIAIMVFSSILYYIELVTCTFDNVNLQWIRDDGTITPFQSIPHTFWFIAASVTTVGYGDNVPGNLGGKAWIVLVMLFGVLVLSFPNILIGSNFSAVHRQLSREKARSQLGRYFRRVRIVIRFVRMWREFRIKGRVDFADSMVSRNGDVAVIADDPSRLTRRMHNFLFRISDFPERNLLDSTSMVARGTIDQVMFHKIPLIVILQRLLECFSGCATVEEITHSFHYFLPQELARPPSIDHVFELVLRAGALQVVSVFILHREDESALLQLSKRGIDTLLSSTRETSSCPCLRGYAEAQGIWQSTTHLQVYDFLPIDGYRAWQAVEGRVPKRSPLDFTYDFKMSEAQLNDIFKGIQQSNQLAVGAVHDNKCTCRYCNMLWGVAAPMRPDRDYCFEPDEEYLALEVEYAQNALKIFKLERRLARVQAAPLDDTTLTVPRLTIFGTSGGSPLVGPRTPDKPLSPYVTPRRASMMSSASVFETDLAMSFHRAPPAIADLGASLNQSVRPVAPDITYAPPPPSHAAPSNPSGAQGEDTQQKNQSSSDSGGGTTISLPEPAIAAS